MRTTLEIDDELLNEALQLTGAKTKKDVVALALTELVRLKLLEELRASLGKMDLDLDQEKLRAMREDD